MFPRARNVVLALVLGALSAACGSAASDTSEAPKPKPEIHDPFVLHASAATRSELGVETWGIYVAPSRSLVVHGYDASNELVVQFEQHTTTTDDRHGSVEASVVRNGATHTVTVAMEAQPGGAEQNLQIRVLENSLASDPGARHVLERILADAKTQPSALSGGGTGGGSSLITKSIHPSYFGESLIDQVGCTLNVKCGTDLLTGTTAAITGAYSCSLLVAGAVATVGCVAATGVTVVLAAGCVVAEGATAAGEAAGCAAGVTGAYQADKKASQDCSCK